MIQKLSKENQNIKKNIKDIKKCHAKAIDLKISEVINILKQNYRQKGRIVELEAKLAKVNSSLKEPINSKDLNHYESSKQKKILTVIKVVLTEIV